MLKPHSYVDIITNSSTTIYTSATQATIEAAIKLLEVLGGNKEEFDFQLYPGEHLIEVVMDSGSEYLHDDMVKEMKAIPGWKDREKYVGDLIAKKKIEYPTENYDDYEYKYEYEWDLVVTRNGEPFTEFQDLFSSFDQYAVYRYSNG